MVEPCAGRPQLTAWEYIVAQIGRQHERPPVKIITPADPLAGCQLSMIVRPERSESVRGLTSTRVIVDWRRPDVIRAAPKFLLYNTFEDVYRFGQLLESGSATEPEPETVSTSGCEKTSRCWEPVLVGSLLSILRPVVAIKCRSTDYPPGPICDEPTSLPEVSHHGPVGSRLARSERCRDRGGIRKVAIPMHGRVLHPVNGELWLSTLQERVNHLRYQRLQHN